MGEAMSSLALFPHCISSSHNGRPVEISVGRLVDVVGAWSTNLEPAVVRHQRGAGGHVSASASDLKSVGP